MKRRTPSSSDRSVLSVRSVLFFLLLTSSLQANPYLPKPGEAPIKAREAGTQTRRKAADIVDNRFAEDLAKSGFLTELWGKDLPK